MGIQTNGIGALASKCSILNKWLKVNDQTIRVERFFDAYDYFERGYKIESI